MSQENTLMMGAVAYAPKVVTIWDGFQRYFEQHGLPLDYILYTNYERQVEALFAGHIHVAWNSPLGWLQAERHSARRSVWSATSAMPEPRELWRRPRMFSTILSAKPFAVCHFSERGV